MIPILTGWRPGYVHLQHERLARPGFDDNVNSEQ